MSYIDELRDRIPTHPPAHECPDPECTICALRDCPHGEPFHYHHDGCPACDSPSVMTQDAIENPSND